MCGRLGSEVRDAASRHECCVQEKGWLMGRARYREKVVLDVREGLHGVQNLLGRQGILWLWGLPGLLAMLGLSGWLGGLLGVLGKQGLCRSHRLQGATGAAAGQTRTVYAAWSVCHQERKQGRLVLGGYRGSRVQRGCRSDGEVSNLGNQRWQVWLRPLLERSTPQVGQ
jgi:hypothetical protein